MKVNFMDHIHFSNGIQNFIEEYCAVLPQAFGRSIKHYRQIDQELVVSCEISTARNNWKDTAKKILILLSHFTIIAPISFFIVKYINRKIAKMNTAPIAILNPDN